MWWDKALSWQCYVLTLPCRQTWPCFWESVHAVATHMTRNGPMTSPYKLTEKNPLGFHLWSQRAPYRAIAPLRHLFSITTQATNGLSDATYENNFCCGAIVKHLWGELPTRLTCAGYELREGGLALNISGQILHVDLWSQQQQALARSGCDRGYWVLTGCWWLQEGSPVPRAWGQWSTSSNVVFSLQVRVLQALQKPFTIKGFSTTGKSLWDHFGWGYGSSALPRALPSDQMALENEPQNISQKVHLLLPFNSLFGCWHKEDFMFPELDACQHPHCSPVHPSTPWTSCSDYRCDVSLAIEYPLLRDLYSRGFRLCICIAFFFFFSVPCI